MKFEVWHKSKNTMLLVGCLSILATPIIIQKCGAESPVAKKDAIAKSAVPAKDNKTHSKKEATSMAAIYDFNAKALDGKDIKFSDYKGDVMLIVNTASKCGYTPQFNGLEELNKKYATRGLRVLGFPCNQFGAQEPGNSEEIGSFCQKNYGVDFQMFEKIDVNGETAHPLYKYLTDANATTKPIKWNFTKFLVDRKGNIVHRFESDVKPEDLTADIEKQL